VTLQSEELLKTDIKFGMVSLNSRRCYRTELELNRISRNRSLLPIKKFRVPRKAMGAKEAPE